MYDVYGYVLTGNENNTANSRLHSLFVRTQTLTHAHTHTHTETKRHKSQIVSFILTTPAHFNLTVTNDIETRVFEPF